MTSKDNHIKNLSSAKDTCDTNGSVQIGYRNKNDEQK